MSDQPHKKTLKDLAEWTSYDLPTPDRSGTFRYIWLTEKHSDIPPTSKYFKYLYALELTKDLPIFEHLRPQVEELISKAQVL
jgi:hypothetical protein